MMILTRRQFIHNLVFNYKTVILILWNLLLFTQVTWAEISFVNPPSSWTEFEKEIRSEYAEGRIEGKSQMISGTLALALGLLGETTTADPIEKGVYAVFQTIGIATIGAGYYKWQVGDEKRHLYYTLNKVSELSLEQKNLIIKSYFKTGHDLEKRERVIRAITHGMIAALNIYNGVRQSNQTVKNALFFIGGVNILATVSYSF